MDKTGNVRKVYFGGNTYKGSIHSMMLSLTKKVQKELWV
ncbi:hypothetical protein SAMN02194393_02104 [Maledivibacter halophilus]|uniref:Uncharacterized protein n=1 Tax=Maledivibacter halophilus TaxID=36842 RepID=A0A1T5KRI4_9FIRM|nr:hypothetical protein SAMN02194393_02104 [Maledivibacter halophilus]